MSKVDDWPTLTNDDLVSTSGESNDFENVCNLNIPCHRITDKSSTLIDLCITNSPDNIVNSGVLHLSISDHSLVYMVRKANTNVMVPELLKLDH